jgi:hypothetical protein
MDEKEFVFDPTIIVEQPKPFIMTRPEKCFCHLGEYKVKDADAQAKLDGRKSIGNINVSSIKSKNLFDLDKIEVGRPQHAVTSQKLGKNKIIFSVSSEMKYSHGYLYINGLEKNTDYTFSAKYTNSNESIETLWISVMDNPITETIINGPFNSGDFKTFNTGDKTSYIIALYSTGDDLGPNSATWYDIQLEKGSVATEFSEPFELATKDDLLNVSGGTSESTKGFYQIDLPLGTNLVFGQGFYRDNEFPEVCNDLLEDLINKIRSDECKNPFITINNTSVVNEVTNFTIKQIVLSHMMQDENEKMFNFYGVISPIGTPFGEVDGEQTQYVNESYVLLSIGYNINSDNSISLDNQVGNLAIKDVSLTTKKYVDDAILNVNAGGSVDMSTYATKDYVDSAIEGIEIPESSGGITGEIPCYAVPVSLAFTGDITLKTSDNNGTKVLNAIQDAVTKKYSYFEIKLCNTDSSYSEYGSFTILFKLSGSTLTIAKSKQVLLAGARSDQDIYLKGCEYRHYLTVSNGVVSPDGDGYVLKISNLSKSTVLLTTKENQSISGVKTFNSIPVCNTQPTSSNQLANKAYVDSKTSKIPTFTVIYENAEGSSDNLTLNDNISSYDFLELYYKHGTGSHSIKVMVEDSVTACFEGNYINNSSSYTSMQSSQATITGNTLEWVNKSTIEFSQDDIQYHNVSSIKIFKIVGIKL